MGLARQGDHPGMNVAQRAGVVASIVWLVVGFGWSFIDQTQRAGDFAALSPTICEQTRDQAKVWAVPDHCWDSFKQDFDAYTHDRALTALFVGVAPIPLAWALAWLLVRTGRWIRFGRWRPRK